ncbi:MAG: hypothetical protein ACRC37_02560 [Lentisphaeria bacterium]
MYNFVQNNAVNPWDVLGLAISRTELTNETAEIKNLLANITKCLQHKSRECCSNLYRQYIEKLANLIRNAGEFYSDQWWISDGDQDAISAVYNLPVVVDGISISSGNYGDILDASRTANDLIGSNIYNKYGNEITNVINFSGGFADGISFGASGAIVNAVGGQWADSSSGAYTGGIITGIATTALVSGRATYVGYKNGSEIASKSKNLRIAPFGNRTGNKLGRFPHYHRRGIDKSGNTRNGQGIGRHRPWEKKSSDKNFRDRF